MNIKEMSAEELLKEYGGLVSSPHYYSLMDEIKLCRHELLTRYAVLEKALELACDKIWDDKHYIPIRGNYIVQVTETTEDIVKEFKERATNET